MTWPDTAFLVAIATCVALAVLCWPARRPESPARRDVRITANALLRRARILLLGPARARRRQYAAQVQLLDSLAAALEAGLPVARAVAVATTRAGAGLEHPAAWQAVHRAAQDGQRLAPAWRRLARVTGSPTVGSVARAWAVAESTGAPLATAVRSAAHAARERHRLERGVDVATAGARATATVLTALPVAGIGLAALLGIGPARLYGTVPALASLLCGLLLLLVGHASVTRMVGSVLRAGVGDE